MNREIDTIVFDFGGVLIPWDYRAAFGWLKPKARRDQFFREFDFLAFNHPRDQGVPFEEGLAELYRAGNPWAAVVAEYQSHYRETLGEPIPGMLELVMRLRQAGYRLYGLTNWWAETYHLAEEAVPAIAHLDGVVVSGQEGVAKPDPAIFHLLAERYQVDPVRAVFIDDSLANVQAAAELGFHTIHFQGLEDLLVRLARLGVSTD